MDLNFVSAGHSRDDVGERRIKEVLGRGDQKSSFLDEQGAILDLSIVALRGLHETLVCIRNASGCSRSDFSLRTGLSIDEISEFERDPLASSIRTLLIYGMATGVPIWTN